jgi:ABC-type transporter Mla MlaB component
MTDVGARLWNGCQRGSPEHTVQPGAPPAESPLRAAYTSPPPTLFLGGEIDESTHRDLRRVLKLAIAARRHVLRVDMADVMYCDLAGLRAMLLLADAGGPGAASVDQLARQHLPRQLETIMRIPGWDATPGLSLAEPVS